MREHFSPFFQPKNKLNMRKKNRACAGLQMKIPPKSLVLLPVILLTIASTFVAPARPIQDNNYAILTNIPETDPFYSAVSLLGSYRSASIVRFLNSVDESLESLKALMPQYVAVAVKPQTIDVDFVAQTYLVLSQLDDEQFLDCSVGFITGATASDMNLLISNTISAENGTRPTKYTAMMNSNTTFGGEGATLNRSQVYSRFFSQSGWATSLVDNYHKPLDLYQRIGNSSITTIDMHGNPTGIENLSSTEIRNGPQQYLFPTVVIASSCYTSVTYRFYQEGASANATIDPNQSFSLSFLKKGAVGYVGHIRMAGANWNALEPVLYGMTFLGLSQGESLKQALNLGLTNFGLPANITLHSENFFGYALYGDPKYTPVPQPLSSPIISATCTIYQNSTSVRLRISRDVSFPKIINGKYQYSDLDEWYQFSAALSFPTINYRFLLPANLNATGVALIGFSDPSNGIQNVYSQGMYLPTEKTAEGTFLYLRLNFAFKNTTQPVWQLQAGTTIDVNVATSTNVIPEFPIGTIFLFAFVVASSIGLLNLSARRRKGSSIDSQLP